jgi:Kelch motif protein
MSSRQHVLIRALAVLCALAPLAGSTQAQGIWIPTGSLQFEQRDHSATLLADGRVLIIGPYSIELYDPATRTFRAITGTVNRDGRPVRLQDGKVLVVGGSPVPSSAVLFDPLTETFSPTGGLNEGRVGPTVTLLPDGRVLVAGGLDASRNAALASAELFDPTTGHFTFAGNLQTARFAHTAALLLDGTVLVAGGE